MRSELSSDPPPSYASVNSQPMGMRDLDRDHQDHQEEWAREEQDVRFFCNFLKSRTDVIIDGQMMIQEQDRTMDSIAGRLSTLAHQAGLMGQEIGEQVEWVFFFFCFFSFRFPMLASSLVILGGNILLTINIYTFQDV